MLGTCPVNLYLPDGDTINGEYHVAVYFYKFLQFPSLLVNQYKLHHLLWSLSNLSKMPMYCPDLIAPL